MISIENRNSYVAFDEYKIPMFSKDSDKRLNKVRWNDFNNYETISLGLFEICILKISESELIFSTQNLNSEHPCKNYFKNEK